MRLALLPAIAPPQPAGLRPGLLAGTWVPALSATPRAALPPALRPHPFAPAFVLSKVYLEKPPLLIRKMLYVLGSALMGSEAKRGQVAEWGMGNLL